MAEMCDFLNHIWCCGISTSIHLYLRNTIIGTSNKQTTFNCPYRSDSYKELVAW